MSAASGELGPCLDCGGEVRLELDGVWDTRFGVPGEFAIGRCAACGLEQTWPRPDQAALIGLYEAHYNFGDEQTGAYTGLRKRFFEWGLYRFWARLDGDISFYLRRGSGRLIDIGCNEGRGLPFYAASGFSVEGLEPNARAAARAEALGFTVHRGTPATFRPERTYDVAVLSNVLEHFLEPAAALEQIRPMLKPGGEVWISCPNAESWLRFWAGARWINWHVPFHIVHFSRASLTRLVERAGYERVEIANETPALWVAMTVIARVFARPAKVTGALRNTALVAGLVALARGLLFPWLALANRRGKGDCLVLIARKVGP